MVILRKNLDYEISTILQNLGISDNKLANLVSKLPVTVLHKKY